MKPIHKDYRGIESISWGNTRNGDECFTASEICEIVPCKEKGPFGPMSYFYVTIRGEIVCRVPAYKVTVYYKKKGNAE